MEDVVHDDSSIDDVYKFESFFVSSNIIHYIILIECNTQQNIERIFSNFLLAIFCSILWWANHPEEKH